MSKIIRITFIALALLLPALSSGAEESRMLYPVKVDGRWGYMDREGQIAIEPRFDKALGFTEGLAAALLDGKYGYLNLDGEWALEPQYQNAGFFNEGLAPVSRLDEDGRWRGWGYIDKTGKEIVKCEWRSASTFSDGRGVCQPNRNPSGQQTVIFDREGSIIARIDCGDLGDNTYSFIEGYADGLLAYRNPVRNERERIGFLDLDGKPAFDVWFRLCRPFSEGLAAMELTHELHYQKCGFINKQGDVVLDGYWAVGRFFDGLAAAAVEETRPPHRGWWTPPLNWGYIDHDGEWVIEPKWGQVWPFSEGRALAVTHTGILEVLDEQGNVVGRPGMFPAGVTHPGYAQSPDEPRFVNGLCRIRSFGNFGVIDLDGNLLELPVHEVERQLNASSHTAYGGATGVLDVDRRRWIAIPEGAAVERFSGDTFAASTDHRSGYSVLNADGEILVSGIKSKFPPGAADGPFVSGDCVSVGYIDFHGKQVIEKRFADGRSFCEGRAAVQEMTGGYRGRWGFIDETGEWIVEPKYDSVGDFKDGVAAVQMGSKTGFIDLNGKPITDCVYSWVKEFSEGFCAVQLDGKFGVIDKRGEWLVKPQYSRIGPFRCGLAVVNDNGKHGYIDKTGRFAIEPKYSSAGDFGDGLAFVSISEKTPKKPVSRLDDPYTVSYRKFVIDKKGDIVFETEYDIHSPFSEGRAVVYMRDAKASSQTPYSSSYYEYIDDEGRLITDLHLYQARDFEDGLAIVRLPERIAYVDRDGKLVWPPTY